MRNKTAHVVTWGTLVKFCTSSAMSMHVVVVFLGWADSGTNLFKGQDFFTSEI